MRRSRSRRRDVRKRMMIKSSLRLLAEMELRAASPPNKMTKTAQIQDPHREEETRGDSAEAVEDAVAATGSRAMRESTIGMASPGTVKRTESSDRGGIGRMSPRKQLVEAQMVIMVKMLKMRVMMSGRCLIGRRGQSRDSSRRKTAARSIRLGRGLSEEVGGGDVEGTGRRKGREVVVAATDLNTDRNSRQASRLWINLRTVPIMIPRQRRQASTEKKKSLMIKSRTVRLLLRVALKPVELTIVAVTTIIGKGTAIAKVIASTTTQTHSSSSIKSPTATK